MEGWEEGQMQEGRAEGQNVTKCRMGFTRVMSPTILYVYRNNTGGGSKVTTDEEAALDSKR